jgi:hypothetical protein
MAVGDFWYVRLSLIASSTLNGDGLDDALVNGTLLDGDIDTGNPPVAWGMLANFGGNFARATRPFTGGALAPGQTFSVNFDNGDFYPEGRYTLALLDALNSPVFEVRLYASFSPLNYQYYDALGISTSSLFYADEGLNLAVTMTSATNYTATLYRFDGVSYTWSGVMSSAPIAFRAEVENTGPTLQYALFLNSMEIVPEPSAIALGGLGAVGVALRLLRHRIRKPAEAE